MVVVASDMKLFLSGGAANTDTEISFGGERSATEVAVIAMNNLFPNVASGQAVTGITQYRCVYVVNDNATDTIDDVTVFLAQQTASNFTDLFIGLDPAGVGDGVITGIAGLPVNDTTAPAGVTFVAPTHSSESLTVGALGPGEGQALWLRRVVDPNAKTAGADQFTVRVAGVPVP